ncbi:MAG TPA: hypothetical protein VGD42_21010 [Lysobacter sp.]
MPSPSALANAFRLLLVGLLLCGVVLKPSLAIAEEMHELLAHAAVAGDGHTHADAHAVETAPSPPKGGQPPHDDNHFHLTHCCGQQSAMLPRMDVALVFVHGDSPMPVQADSFAPAPHTAPFRPPIAA